MGDWKLGYHTDNTYAKVTNDGAIVINNPITEIEKDDSGNKYDSYNEFNSAVSDFFVKASGGSGEASWGGVSGNIEDQEDLTNALDSKVDKVAGKQLSDENYTLAEKQKLEGLSSLALGETASTAYRGDRGKEAYDHSQSAHAPSNAQKNSDITKAEIEAKLTGAITSHTHSAYVPTSRTVAGKALTGNITLAKGDVGLGNVDNTSDANKPVSTAQQTALNAKIDANKFQVVTELPASPDQDTFYFIEE